MSGRSAARVNRGHGGQKIRFNLRKRRACGGVGPSDQNVVPARLSGLRQNRARGGSETPFRAIADHGTADPSGTGKTHARRSRVAAIPGLQHERRTHLFAPSGRCQKFGPFFQNKQPRRS